FALAEFATTQEMLEALDSDSPDVWSDHDSVDIVFSNLDIMSSTYETAQYGTNYIDTKLGVFSPSAVASIPLPLSLSFYTLY
ncbi:hypothetical protein KIPB_016676, partial [Kipferlia bialata]